MKERKKDIKKKERKKEIKKKERAKSPMGLFDMYLDRLWQVIKIPCVSRVLSLLPLPS